MKRLNHIDGLKGWCASLACILHFLLMFKLDGFVGWKCLPEAASNPVEYYFDWMPYSVFITCMVAYLLLAFMETYDIT